MQKSQKNSDNVISLETNNVILPKKSQLFLSSLKNNIDGMNPYLIQNRFSCKIKEDKKEKYVPLLYEKLKKNDIEDKKFYNGEWKKIEKELGERNQKLAGHFPKNKSYEYKPYDKIFIGEGGDLYLNMLPFKFHPLYGLPFIPASAMKGALRSAWILEKSDKNTNLELEDKDFIELFGGAETDSGHTMGMLVFFDIFPKKFTLSLDVQTPHFKKYYELKGEPSDDINPVPIPFVCLKKSEFQILISCRDAELWLQNKDKIDYLMDIVFTQLGIGAKSSLGYGIV